MSEVIRKRFNCDILELPEFLKNQASQGLHLIKITRNRLVFRQGEPADYDFNIIPVNNSLEFDRVNDIDGWTNLISYGEFVILYAPAGTPFTMPIDKNITMTKLSFMRTMYIVRLTLATVGTMFSILGITQYYQHNTPLFILSLAMCAILVFFGVLELLPLLRLVRCINKLTRKETV